MQLEYLNDGNGVIHLSSIMAYTAALSTYNGVGYLHDKPTDSRYIIGISKWRQWSHTLIINNGIHSYIINMQWGWLLTWETHRFKVQQRGKRQEMPE